VPLDRSESFDQVRAFARDLADLAAAHEPERLTTETRKDKRQGRVFLDYLRNGYGATSVAPYAVRAKPGAPVATPIEWDRVSDPELGPQSYTIRNIFRRLGQVEDPWADIMDHAGSLQAPRRQLDELRSEGNS